MKGISQHLLFYTFELFSFEEKSNDFSLQFQALFPHMTHLLNNRSIETFKLETGPIYSSLWISNRLEVFTPWTLFSLQFMVHHEHTKHIELAILTDLIVEKVIILLEHLFESWIIVALLDR